MHILNKVYRMTHCAHNIMHHAHLQALLIPLIALFVVSPAKGQFNMLFTSDYDLPNSLVNKIAEDSYGMIWVATEDGLCRYNGSRFITYRAIPGDENSISGSFVRTVCTDQRGHTLIGGIKGLQMYNRTEDNFSKIIKTESIGLPTRNINGISLLRNGDFAVIGINTFNVHIDDNGNVTLKRNALSGKITNGYHIIDDPKGNLWAACGPLGVLRADAKGHVVNIKATDGSQYDFSDICVGNDGKLYAASIMGGLYCFNESTKHFDLLKGTEGVIKIRDIQAVPNSSTLCVATDGYGVKMYDVSKHVFVASRNFNDPFIDMSTQKVNTIYINKAGDIWMGLYQKGIFMATQNVTAFGYIGSRSQRYNIIGNRCVTSLVQRHDGTIWIGTDNGGLYGITPEMELIKSFPCDDANGLPASLLGLYEDSKGRLWFGSYNHGCGTIDVSSGKCHYVTRKGAKGLLYSVYHFVEDKRGQLWASTMGQGILCYDEKTEEMVKYTDANGTLWSGTMFYDKNNDIIYCGTYDGIVWFRPTDAKRTTHTIGPKAVIYSIARLSPTTIGFGTTDGLLILDTKTNKIRQITAKDGLSNSNIFALQRGNNGYVWMSSGGGLMRYDINRGSLETFTVKDGLQGNEFYKDASMISKDGRLWFGGINGITVFAPGEISGNNNIHCLARVVSLRAGERDICSDEDGNYTIPAGIDAFNVELAALPIYMTHRVTYLYRLDHGEWQMLPVPQNRILFDNLSWGSHTLHTKTVIDGIESEVTDTEIYVTYPWFLRWWANLIWLAIIAVTLYYVRMFLHRRHEMKKALLEHQREEETKESKLQFFMNIVHDLRTPLTLIETPLQKLKAMGDDDKHQRLYDIMSRNTDRLLSLTNEIMDLRKLDRGKMQLYPHNALISKHINEITDAMRDMINTRHQQLILTDHTDGKQMMYIDAQAFGKILTNLLSNAIKYTPEGGQIEVEWNTSLLQHSQPTPASKPFPQGGEKQSLILSVTDNGIGISDDAKKHIFERFYQVQVNDKHIKGTGIGLDLVRSLVELHNGEITVSDNPAGKGTRFTIIIPNQRPQSQQSTPSPLPSSPRGGEDLNSLADGNSNESNSSETIIKEKTDGQYASQTEQSNGQSTLNSSIPDLPQQAGPSPRGGREGASGSSGSAVSSSILIVDDDDDIRTFLCEEMAASFNILEASDGKKAFEILNRENIDLVVSDVMMPEMDGIELTRKIRGNVRLAHIPIILLTAKASDQDRLEGLQATADAYVTKPFNLDLLQTLIVNILVRNDKLQKSFKYSELSAEHVDTPKVQSADDQLLERLLKVINDNLNNPDLTTDLLAQEAGISRGHLYRKLKELTNQSATNFIRNIRLTKAAEILRQRHCTVAEVAYLVGFRTPAHFSTAFKELYGMTPREYMNKDNDE